MDYLIGIIGYIVIGVVTFFVAHVITSIIGYDGMIVYVVAFVIVLALIFYLAKKEKSLKEKRLINNWAKNGYGSAIAMMNEVLPEGYKINNSEVGIIEEIFYGTINEAKKEHFDSDAVDSDYELLKKEDAWLAWNMAKYCTYRCSWKDIREGQMQMLKYAGAFSELNTYFNKTYVYDKYEYTASGIVAEKIMLASALLNNGNGAEFKHNLDKGYTKELIGEASEQ